MFWAFLYVKDNKVFRKLNQGLVAQLAGNWAEKQT